ncbi:YciI family protein [Tropicimonas isoalkanivorans]|uniref:YCII-related domain-containing protein n=1 Tax=Tropicimonas isoalkanivorans TaxID=441112 RepID=A0A1I1IH39_9RHOB|nr:YciI family protein [Tropicimonas isoalkanivorans]SFC33528.1 YCII-related domain-containing protein [Tropicimonas isoalkanivorans]
MSTQTTFLAVFLGSQTSARMQDWKALDDDTRKAREQEGMAAWQAWTERHSDAIVEIGGPLGKTRRVSADGIEEVSNALGGFSIVRAESHEAAAKLFEDHPHYTIFPGDAVEVMPILSIPDM